MKKTVMLLPIFLVLAACAKQSPAANQITIQGSDTEVQLVSALVEAFNANHPDSDISVAGGGSAVGIAALLNGETDIANSSRQLSAKELETAKAKNMNVREFILARDGLSIIVHPDNPLKTLSMDQLSKIFQGTIENWKDVGGPDAPIVLYGRQSASGTFGFFRDTVVKGDYAKSMRQMEGTQAIFDAVRSDANAIGYAGVGYIKGADGNAMPEIKILTVSKVPGGIVYSPLDRKAVEEQDYPISRRIYQFLPATPASGSLLEQFLIFEASDEGQAIVEKSGFYSTIAADKRQNGAFFSTIR